MNTNHLNTNNSAAVSVFSVVSIVSIVSGLLLLFSFNHAMAKVSLDEILKGLPERKVTLDIVLKYALQSNSFKVVASGAVTSLATKIRAEAPLDFKVTAKWQNQKEMTKPQSLLSPEEINTQLASIGFSKAFQTGTTIGGEWVNRKVETLYADASTGNPIFDNLLRDRSEYVPELSLNLRQELLKNSFGGATRAGLRAAEKQAAAQQLSLRESVKDWYFELLKTFYGAWLAQKQLRHADNDVQRQQRLFRVSEQRYRRGNTELADFLQVKVGLNLAEQKRLVAKQKLLSVWRDVVTQLELPASWLQIDPLEIPVEMDDPVSIAKSQCDRNWNESEDAGLKMAHLEAEALEEQVVASKSRLLPDLSLTASLKRGGRHASSASALQEVEKGSYPATYYGVQLDWNLDMSLEKAQWLESEAQARKARSVLEIKKSSLSLLRQNHCENFLRLLENQQQLQVALSDQVQRLDLEEKRFREGRALLFQVIQAQGDLQTTMDLESQNATDLRLTAWQAVRQSSFMEEKLNQFL